MKRPVQYFTKEYLDRCSNMKPDQILEFIDEYQQLVFREKEKCRPISIKIEPSLLKLFKQKAALKGIPYQTQIKALMREWLNLPLH